MTEPRELAVQALYEADILGSLDVAERLSGKAERLTRGVLADVAAIDAALARVSDHWAVDRMPVVDRVILRLATYELANERDTPTAVIIAEAVRIAKVFSTEKSGKFVNGILGALAAQIRSKQ